MPRKKTSKVDSAEQHKIVPDHTAPDYIAPVESQAAAPKNTVPSEGNGSGLHNSKLNSTGLYSSGSNSSESHSTGLQAAAPDSTVPSEEGSTGTDHSAPPSSELITQDQAAKIVKKKRNRPDLANFGAEHAEAGDNTRFLRYALVSWDMPPIDISDPNQVKQRIFEYFTYCADNDRKPSIIGMANWLGVDRSTLSSWKRGEFRADTVSPIIKKAVSAMEEQWYDYMQNGKVNPASGIFLGKNVFGYRDVQDVVVTPNQPIGEEVSATEIQKRIEEGTVIEGSGTAEDDPGSF